MPKHHFEHTNMLIADAGGQIRTEIKQVLRYEGFRNIVEAENVDDAREAVINNYIDVIITDNILNQADMCQSIRDIRHGALGNNPFIVVITMATDPAREDIMSIIDSGADDIILPLKCSREILKGVANGKLVVIEGSAHLTTMERPETVTEVMRQWLTNELAMDGKELIVQ